MSTKTRQSGQSVVEGVWFSWAGRWHTHSILSLINHKWAVMEVITEKRGIIYHLRSGAARGRMVTFKQNEDRMFKLWLTHVHTLMHLLLHTDVYYSTVNSPLILYVGKSLYLFPLGDTFKPEESLTCSEDRREWNCVSPYWICCDEVKQAFA